MGFAKPNDFYPEKETFLKAPPFTLSQLKAAIPSHCFVRSYLTSLRYLFVDLLALSVFGYVAYRYIDTIPDQYLTIWLACWGLYWFLQGSVMTGLWVLAHECGHQAFSPSAFLNDIIGFVIHSFMLVPYFSWKISHGKHHQNTGSYENDEVFVPKSWEVFESQGPEDGILSDIWGVVSRLLFGWPTYLFLNSTGPEKYFYKKNSHFNPNSVLFSSKQAHLVILSDLGFVGALFVIGYFTYQYGLWVIFKLYFLPLLVTNANLVCLTYLQHTHTQIPHFRTKEWTWLRGALCTVDRNYGWFINMCHHHISDTHICHHIFSQIPHYHAEEATAAIKPILGKYYNFDDTGIWQSLFQTCHECKFVDVKGNILFYKSQ
eukprot:Sdes_comp19019_c0_seq1m9565